jgi:hypothetical protein
MTIFATIGRSNLDVRLTPGIGNTTQDMTEGIAHIKGRVVDMLGVPIPHALVEVNGSAVQTGTDGNFSVPVDAGEVTVTATAVSKTSSSVKTYVDTSGGQDDLEVQISFDTPETLPGDRDALKANLSTCGAAIIGMSIFMLFTA